MTLKKIVAGGQTGADRAGWDAAKDAGIKTGGWMPLGYDSEDGKHPEFALQYDAKEWFVPAYPARTKLNIQDSDATIVFNLGTQLSKGTVLAIGMGRIVGKEVRVVIYDPEQGWSESPADIARWIESREIETLNVAGNRETNPPSVYPIVKIYMARVLKILQGVE